ncbi:hypothetical protein F66182_2729 [Fusarium sp. NRRL 66182]|nr:hypothetical protein F66182_2729 [Fusarium sp. NRRL 66182]
MAATSFLDLPLELRSEIYSYSLVCNDAIPLTWPQFHGKPSDRQKLFLSPQILSLNKQIRHEAAQYLYGKNRFSTYSDSSLSFFLREIGPINASMIQHLRFSFPSFRYDAHTGMTLAKNCGFFAILDVLGEKCPSMALLEISVSSSRHLEDHLGFNIRVKKRLDLVDEALDTIDEKFKTLPSLRRVTVDVPEVPLNAHVRERMRRYEWTINPVFWDEEEWQAFYLEQE